MVPTLEHTAQVSREQAELLDCRKCLIGERKSILPYNVAPNIQMADLPKVISALCTASQLPGEGTTDVDLHVNQNPMMMMMMMMMM